MTHVLVLGTAEWDQAIATNQHYAVRELARANDVTFVQSMGLRKVELKARDLVRIAQRIQRIASPGRDATRRRPVPDRVHVVSPRVIPRHRGWTRRLNKKALAGQFREWSTSSDARVLWLYSPLDYGLAEHADLIVYHCVDLLGTFPGIDSGLITDAERHLASLDHVVAAGSSPAVVAHLESMGFGDPLFWPNVADTDSFTDPVPATGHTRRSAAVFAGNLTKNKVDFALLHSLVDARIELHLAGPIAEGGGDTRAAVDDLVSRGASYHGLLDLPALATLQSSCSVGLIPYVRNDYTAGVSPLKTFEYLASGLAVVSTGVPSVQEIDGHVSVVRPENFVAVTRDILLASPPPAATVASRKEIAEGMSWNGRGRVLRDLVVDSLSRDPLGGSNAGGV